MRIAVAGGTGTVGRHVVDVAGERGHDVRVLSRSRGVDLVDGTGLDAVLEGVDAVVDVASVMTQSAEASIRFFRTVSTNLLAAGARAAVAHHVALSIVGVDRAPLGYYAGKVAQEDLVSTGPVPWTLLRATQFHEFAEQLFRQLAIGPLHPVPVMRSQPVAAREVAERLVALSEAGPAGRVPDLAGPEVLRMSAMVRAYARATGRGAVVLPVPLPGALGRAFRDGTLTAGPDADRGVRTFAGWVAGLSG
ncbi:3-beta hydroxysteroid dehydrogenase [Blastococcus sp. TBT05-19]|uniref:SDR family oxidoreductase n=1 Tax=Blastococcus sp. TBT05-19 TaxID=2250581 RepID=UPI000DEAB0C6|nr:SDR family oxidoreductase [Blastococcus sp. TBT05-19]RBY94419.1 3-beta hydroxysteroid dehydrogenase [Blastococcus sp. TBT05-19]